MTETAIFGGGCFWCTEAIFQNLKGVVSVKPGYAGGQMPNPSYEDVSTGETGHAEVIKIEFDPEQISYHDLLEVFFATHDPTTRDRQGGDVGSQYRSIIFYTLQSQKQEAEKFIHPPMVTEVVPFDKFYDAEEYHRNYYRKNQDKPYCQVIINPKLKKLREKFAGLTNSPNNIQ